jgi:hypothetical protein
MLPSLYRNVLSEEFARSLKLQLQNHSVTEWKSFEELIGSMTANESIFLHETIGRCLSREMSIILEYNHYSEETASTTRDSFIQNKIAEIDYAVHSTTNYNVS